MGVRCGTLRVLNAPIPAERLRGLPTGGEGATLSQTAIGYAIYIGVQTLRHPAHCLERNIHQRYTRNDPSIGIVVGHLEFNLSVLRLV